MLNFGVCGYSTIHYYLQIDKIIQYKPDMVLIGFLGANDFEDNVFWNRNQIYKPYAEITSDGKLEIKGYPLPNRFNQSITLSSYNITALEKNSYLAHRLKLLFKKLTRENIDKIEQRGLIGLETKDFYLEKSNNIELVNKAISVNELLLEEIKNKLEMNGIKFVVLEIPSKFEYGVEPAYEWSNTKKKNYKVHNALITTLEKLNIDRIELIEEITPEDFYIYDGHWRASGHEKAAKKILEFLNEQGVVK
jgi:hypothetical protein